MKRVIILLLLATPLYAQEDRVIERWECRYEHHSWDKVSFITEIYEGQEWGRVSSGGVIAEETDFALVGLDRSWFFCNEERGGFCVGNNP